MILLNIDFPWVEVQIGFLGAITPAITFIVSPLWGALADLTGGFVNSSAVDVPFHYPFVGIQYRASSRNYAINFPWFSDVKKSVSSV